MICWLKFQVNNLVRMLRSKQDQNIICRLIFGINNQLTVSMCIRSKHDSLVRFINHLVEFGYACQLSERISYLSVVSKDVEIET